MAKKRFSEMFESGQDRQFAGLLSDVLDKIDERFSDLDETTQARFKDAAREIATMRSDLERTQSGYRQRFHELADHYHSGGGYVGPFHNRDAAETFGRFVAAVAQGPAAVKALAEDQQFASINPQSGAEGGFLMPEVMLAGIVDNAERYGVFERNVRVWPVQGESVSRVRRSQGATVYYPDYGGGPTESELKGDRIRTEMPRYSVLAYLDRWMMNNANLAVALGDYVAGELGSALSYATDQNAFVGDASESYARVRGLFNLTSGLKVTADSGDTTFQKIIDESVKYPTKAAGQLPDIADDESCKWYLHREIFWNFLGVRDANDRPIADILTKGEKPQRVLCGYPAEVTQAAPKMADTAVSTAIGVLANIPRAMEMYRNPAGAELRISEHVKFIEGEVAMLLDVPQGIAHLDDNMSVRVVTAAS